MEPEDPYRILGVEPDADADAVRKAYLRAVRRHPPERDPEGFSRVRRAYELLSDPARRGEWDARHGWNGEVLRLFAEALEREEKGRLVRAGALLKRALVLAPGFQPARLALVRILQGRGRHRDAIRELDRLLEAGAEDRELLLLGARARRLAAEAEGRGRRRFRRLVGEALELLDRAVDPALPPDPGHCLEQARLLLLQDQPQRALEVLESPLLPAELAELGADCEEDVPLLVLACLVHLDRRDRAAFRACLRRLQEAATDPEVAREAATEFAGEAARRARRGDLVSLASLVRAAEVLAGEDPEVQPLLEMPRDVAALVRERQELPLEMGEARTLLGLEIDYLRLPKGEDEGVLAHWGEAEVRFRGLDPERLEPQLGLLQASCPTFLRRNESLVLLLQLKLDQEKALRSHDELLRQLEAMYPEFRRPPEEP